MTNIKTLNFAFDLPEITDELLEEYSRVLPVDEYNYVWTIDENLEVVKVEGAVVVKGRDNRKFLEIVINNYIYINRWFALTESWARTIQHILLDEYREFLKHEMENLKNQY